MLKKIFREGDFPGVQFIEKCFRKKSLTKRAEDSFYEDMDETIGKLPRPYLIIFPTEDRIVRTRTGLETAMSILGLGDDFVALV